MYPHSTCRDHPEAPLSARAALARKMPSQAQQRLVSLQVELPRGGVSDFFPFCNPVDEVALTGRSSTPASTRWPTTRPGRTRRPPGSRRRIRCNPLTDRVLEGHRRSRTSGSAPEGCRSTWVTKHLRLVERGPSGRPAPPPRTRRGLGRFLSAHRREGRMISFGNTVTAGGEGSIGLGLLEPGEALPGRVGPTSRLRTRGTSKR